MMEKTKIGLNAGKVWRILNEKGELSLVIPEKEMPAGAEIC